MAIPIFKEHANGIRDVKTGILYPYRSQSAVPGVVLPQKPNVRYYLASAVITISSLVTDAGTEASLEGVQFLQNFVLARLVKTTLVVNQISQVFPLGVYLDKEATLSFLAADITTASVTVKYAEVDDCA